MTAIFKLSYLDLSHLSIFLSCFHHPDTATSFAADILQHSFLLVKNSFSIYSFVFQSFVSPSISLPLFSSSCPLLSFSSRFSFFFSLFFFLPFFCFTAVGEFQWLLGHSSSSFHYCLPLELKLVPLLVRPSLCATLRPLDSSVVCELLLKRDF